MRHVSLISEPFLSYRPKSEKNNSTFYAENIANEVLEH